MRIAYFHESGIAEADSQAHSHNFILQAAGQASEPAEPAQPWSFVDWPTDNLLPRHDPAGHLNGEFSYNPHNPAVTEYPASLPQGSEHNHLANHTWLGNLPPRELQALGHHPRIAPRSLAKYTVLSQRCGPEMLAVPECSFFCKVFWSNHEVLEKRVSACLSAQGLVVIGKLSLSGAMAQGQQLESKGTQSCTRRGPEIIRQR